MALTWTAEHPAKWDADKARIIGNEEAGIFDARFSRLEEGDLVPGDWWRVSDDGRTVGYGWMDVVWGDAEITLATEAEARHRGVGSFTLEKLGEEAQAKGFNYLYNTVRQTHPHAAEVSAWLEKRGFQANEDGSLFTTTLARKT